MISFHNEQLNVTMLGAVHEGAGGLFSELFHVAVSFGPSVAHIRMEKVAQPEAQECFDISWEFRVIVTVTEEGSKDTERKTTEDYNEEFTFFGDALEAFTEQVKIWNEV